MQAMKVDRDLTRAIGRFREALQLDPAHEDSIYYLGNCLAETGNLDEALEQFEKLMQIDPLSHRAYKRWGTLRAMTAESEKDLEAAEVALERALSINPEATGALLLLGEVALIRGDLATARQRLEWVRRTNPSSMEALFLLAYLAWREGDGALADELLQAARESGNEEWKPEGVVAEGDVERTMHQDVTLLRRFVDTWNGTADADAAFADLEARLGS
jgi:tetratricopeptide (TPR) repeat protein